MSNTLLSIETAIGGIGRGFTSAPVRIGGLTLTGVEVPSVYERGGGQQLVVHRLIGGGRVINPFGSDPARRVLAGILTGPTALSRASQFEAMRDAGAPVTLSLLGKTETVVIASFVPQIAQRGAVIPYVLEAEVLPVVTSAATGASALASLIGPDAATALTSATTALSNAATYAANLVGQAQTIAGDAVSVASIVGLGGSLATIQNNLTAASALVGSGTNLATAPASLASFVTDMQSAGQGIMTSIAGAGGSITGISTNAANGVASDGPSLAEVTAQSGVLAGLTQAGGYVNRSLLAAGAGAVVHS